MKQKELSAEIAERLEQNISSLQAFWATSSPVRHCFLDDLLPAETALRIHDSLPDAGSLLLRNSIKERKRVGIKLEDYAPEMSAILFAFQDERVIRAVAAITGLERLSADASLYGSGISQMMEND